MQNDRVVVVGAGPVGFTAALALGRRGIPTVLLAAESELVMELRGSTFHPPTLDLLDEFGIVPRMIDMGLKAPTWQLRDRPGLPVATFDLSLLAGDTNHPYRVQCEQWKLTRLLEEELRKLPGSDIRFGHQVTSVRQDGDVATVTADTSSGPVSIAGRCVIGADGARSAVRRSLGVEFDGFTYPELFLIASTDFPFERTLTDIAYVNYIADPLEWLVLLRVPDLWRVLVPARPLPPSPKPRRPRPAVSRQPNPTRSLPRSRSIARPSHRGWRRSIKNANSKPRLPMNCGRPAPGRLAQSLTRATSRRPARHTKDLSAATTLQWIWRR
jgi:3-(3-hydroxy-phenyl)propionate hydroxylase